MCDSEIFFLDVYERALGGTHDAGHLWQSLFYTKNRNEILQEHEVTIGGQQILPYVVGDSAYPIVTQIQKSFTARTSRNAHQNAYDENMKKRRVHIEMHSDFKNRWSILKNVDVEV